MINSPANWTNEMFGVALHKLLIHFPITLAVVACGYDLWAVRSRDRTLHRVGSALIKFAALTALAAAGTGLDLAGTSGLGSASTVTGHAALALLTTFLLVVTALARYTAETRSSEENPSLSSGVLLAETGAAALILVTAIMGHRI